MSSITGTAGEPRWGSGDAPNLAASFNELSEFVLKRGNMLKGTTAERNAFAASGYVLEGDNWRDTTLKATFVYESGAWVRQRGRLEAGTITMIRGVLDAAHVQSITSDGELATLTMRVDNGSGLTLNSSYQVIATIPAGMRPAKDVVFAGTRADAIGGALVRVAPNGEVSAASSGASVTFAVSYPVA